MERDNNFMIREPYFGWLDEFITTDEAERLTGVPGPTLVTMRSRGGGPAFVNPEGTRIIRYQRRALYGWMFSRGVLSNTAEQFGLQNLAAANDNKGDS